MSILQSIEANRLRLKSGQEVDLPFPIAFAIDFDNVIVALVSPPRGTIYNENVFGIGPDAAILWQIEPIYPPTSKTPWGGLERSGSEAVLSNWESIVLHVDPLTGRIKRRGRSVR